MFAFTLFALPRGADVVHAVLRGVARPDRGRAVRAAERTAAGIVAAELVVEPLQPGGPAKDTEIGVLNLPGAAGYAGPDKYLLLLVRQEDATINGHPAYLVVGQQRSPGAELDGVGPPMIYRWGSDVEAQARRLFPR